MRPTEHSDGSNDSLVVSENVEQALRKELGRCFALKEELIGLPKTHLGGCVQKAQLDNAVRCGAFTSSQQVQAAIKNVEEHPR
jgi:hypothetical protein